MSKFEGFIFPKSNYFRLPNDWMDIVHDVKSLAELKVVMYVLRHTWGYNGEEGRPKRISIDEFANGRKRKGGERIDQGTGLSISSVKVGLKLAVEHGLLKVKEDRTDLARIKRYYSLMMMGDYDEDSLQTPNFRGLDSNPLPLESNPLPLESNPRSRKDNSGKTTREKQPLGQPGVAQPKSSHLFPSNGVKHRRPNPRLDAFDMKVGEKLKKIIVENQETSLINVKESTLAERIHRLRKEGISEERIKALVMWLKDHYSEEDIAHFRRADDVFDHFKRLEDAMKRKSNGCIHRGVDGREITRDNMNNTGNCFHWGSPKVWVDTDGKQYDGMLVHRVQSKCKELFPEAGVYFNQEQTDEALEALGEKPGSIPRRVASMV